MNNQKLVAEDWEISELSYSDHNLITFNPNLAKDKVKVLSFLGRRCIIKGPQNTELHKHLFQLFSKSFQIENNEGNTKEIDKNLNTKIKVQKVRHIYRGVR